MNLRSHLFFAGALLLVNPLARAESAATNAPPGAVEPQSSAAAQPETSAPPQVQTKSAPGAASPNGANGTTVSGKKVTKSPNTSKKKGKKESAVPTGGPVATTPTAPVEAVPPPPAKAPVSVLENYLQDLNDALKLSADEKKDIQTYYLKDGPTLQTILSDATVSPLQQAQQVSDLRDKRNDKIAALLGADDRRRDFLKVEALYRVALTEAAADGKLNPSQPLSPVPAPTDVTPGEAEPTPSPKNPVL